MELINWVLDNAIWLMLVANVFSLMVGYWLGSEHANSSTQVDGPDRELTGKTSPSSRNDPA